MPDTTLPTPVATPVVPRDKKLVRGAINNRKGALVLDLDCTELHVLLRSLGLTVEGGRFEGAPAGPDLIDTNTNTVTARCLCRAPGGKSVNTFPLSDAYSQPPSVATLQRVARSINDAIDAVIRHYQPIEILISPAVKPTTPATGTVATTEHA